jgi:hypothetical protein
VSDDRDRLDRLRLKLRTVHQPPFLPLYLHDADVELLGPELTHGTRPETSLWERSVWIAPCDMDGYTWVAYRRQPSQRYERRRKKIEARREAQGRPPSLRERARRKAEAKKQESAP